MAGPERFELPTFWFVARHSIQLSYGPAQPGNYTDQVLRLHSPLHADRLRGGTLRRPLFCQDL
jgi:hypothetical protein